MKNKKIKICMECSFSRFPKWAEQCYKFGGLICKKAKTPQQKNVGKYQECQFNKSKK